MRIFYSPVTSLFSGGLFGGRPDPVVIEKPAPAAPEPEPEPSDASATGEGRNLRRRRARSTLLTEQQRDAGGRTSLLGG